MIEVNGSVSTSTQEVDLLENRPAAPIQRFSWATGSLSSPGQPATCDRLPALCSAGSAESWSKLLIWSGAHSVEARPTADALLAHARSALGRSTPQGVVADRQALRATEQILQAVVTAGQPTPQVAIEEDGSVDTSWLVNECRVSLYVMPSGEGYVSAMDSSGADELGIEFDTYRSPLDIYDLTLIRDRLVRLGRHARHRIVR